MIRAIANKPLELSDNEFIYYQQIVEAFGEGVFQDAFEVDDNESSLYYGFITLVKPSMNKSLPIGVILFLMNCMINQRVREFEKLMIDMRNIKLEAHI